MIDKNFSGHNEHLFESIKRNETSDIFITWENSHKFISNAIDRDGSIFDPACGDATILKTLSLWSSKTLIPYGVDFDIRVLNKARELYPQYKQNFFCEDFINFNIKKIPKVDFGYFAIFDNYDFTEDFQKKWILKLSSIVDHRLIFSMYGEKNDEEFLWGRIHRISSLLHNWKGPNRIEGFRINGYEAFYFDKEKK